jgi:Pectate lyase superfamily protein
MNKAITDGLDLMPPPFVDGLNVWSSGDGTPGSTSYSSDPNGNLVPSDPDFGTCLEIFKAGDPQKLRWKGEVPLLPGCYLEVTARVKAISGPLPSVRVSGWAGAASGSHVTGLVEYGPAVALDAYGRVETVRAIVGSGNRTGVEMVWGNKAVYGHFGIDVEGDNGAVIRVESIEVRDVTSVFHRTMMGWVDVRDYGAIGDGITDDALAFEAADSAANGRDVVVPAGTYYLGKNITMLHRCQFEGTIVQAEDDQFILREGFDYAAYVEAFGDEALALKKALQALFNFSDHESLDLCGRRIDLDAPIDVHAAVSNINAFSARRAIRNGQIAAKSSAAWTTGVVTSTGEYSGGKVLSNVTNIAQIEIGSRIEGYGVGREVYVVEKNESTGELITSRALGRAQASQSYTFYRYRYLLDFSGFADVDNFNIDDIEFACDKRCSAIMLAKDGIGWSIRDCRFSKVANRAITSYNLGCNGLSVDRNQFEAYAPGTVAERDTVALNTNRNDIKIRDNRVVQFKHFAVMSGGGHLFVGNHFWQLDSAVDGERFAGIVLQRRNPKTTITGNYIDSMSIEITNEHNDNTPANDDDGPFGNLTITGNIFTGTHVPRWFNYIRIIPTGSGHTMAGISVIGNTFKNFDGYITDYVSGVDTSFGSIDHTKTKEVVFSGNSYLDVTHHTENPLLVEISRSSAQMTWLETVANRLPFGGRVMGAEGLTAIGPVERNDGTDRFEMPFVQVQQGTNGSQVGIRWSEALKGKVQLRVRSDIPV